MPDFINRCTLTHICILKIYNCVYVLSWSVTFDSLQLHSLGPAKLLCPWSFPGKNTGVDCHFLCLGIFPAQGSNLHFLHWQADSLTPCHLGSFFIYIITCPYIYIYTHTLSSLLFNIKNTLSRVISISHMGR